MRSIRKHLLALAFAGLLLACAALPPVVRAQDDDGGDNGGDNGGVDSSTSEASPSSSPPSGSSFPSLGVPLSRGGIPSTNDEGSSDDGGSGGSSGDLFGNTPLPTTTTSILPTTTTSSRRSSRSRPGGTVLSGVDPTPSGTDTGIDVAGIVDSVTQVQNAFDANVVDDEGDNGNNNNNGGGGGGGSSSPTVVLPSVNPAAVSVDVNDIVSAAQQQQDENNDNNGGGDDDDDDDAGAFIDVPATTGGVNVAGIVQDVTPATPAREDAGAIIDARRNAVVDPTFPPPASQESGPIVPSASELANAATAAASNNGEGEGEGDGATRPSEETARPSAQGNGNSGSGGGGDGDGAIGTTGLVLEGVNPTVNTGAADEEVGALVEGASLADPLDERTGAVGTLFDDRAAAGNLQAGCELLNNGLPRGSPLYNRLASVCLDSYGSKGGEEEDTAYYYNYAFDGQEFGSFGGVQRFTTIIGGGGGGGGPLVYGMLPRVMRITPRPIGNMLARNVLSRAKYEQMRQKMQAGVGGMRRMGPNPNGRDGMGGMGGMGGAGPQTRAPLDQCEPCESGFQARLRVRQPPNTEAAGATPATPFKCGVCVDAMQMRVRFPEQTLETFDAQAFHLAVSDALVVNPRRVLIQAVEEGSVIVTLKIMPKILPPLPSNTTQGEGEGAFQMG